MVSIRRMEVNDLPRVWELGVEEFDMTKLYHQYWTLAELVHAMVNDADFCIVAEEKDEIVGFAIGHRKFSAWREDLSIIEWCAVEKKHQKRGIGTKLCRELIERFRKTGARGVIADVKADNEASAKLLRKLLFKKRFTVDWLIRKL